MNCKRSRKTVVWLIYNKNRSRGTRDRAYSLEINGWLYSYFSSGGKNVYVDLESVAIPFDKGI